VYAGDFFFAIAHPGAENYATDGLISCRLPAAGEVGGEAPVRTRELVLGAGEAGGARRAFLAYIDHTRPVKARMIFLVNDWYWKDKSRPLAALEALARVKRESGVPIDSFTLDDGWDFDWDEETGIWGRLNRERFPGGWEALQAAGRPAKLGISLWFGPIGGYSYRPKRIAFARGMGYEIQGDKLCLAGPRYRRHVVESFSRWAARGMDYIKVDGFWPDCRTAGHGHPVGPGGTIAQMDALMEVFATWRRARPDLVIGYTSGSNPSPFWLQHADFVWRGGRDDSHAGAGEPFDRHNTYLDSCLQLHRQTDMPVSAFVTFDIVQDRIAGNRDEVFERGFWWLAARTSLHHDWYFQASDLTLERWKMLARAARWARGHEQLFRFSRMAGGDPRRGEVYGFAAYDTGRGTLALRNPSAERRALESSLAELLELPAADRSRSFELRGVFGETAALAGRRRAAAPLRVELPPLEIAVFEVERHRPPRTAAREETPPIGFDALLGFDRLSLLVDWPACQDSSYHRDDINQDAGNFLRVEENGDQVLVDTEGPGVVYRIWSTGVVGMQMSERCRLRFFFDGEAKPRLDLSMPELFGDEGSRWPFVPPLSVTFESGRGPGEGPCNLCYVPIPFAKHLKIVGRNVMFYHVDYHKLPPGTRLESFSRELAGKHRGILEKAAAQLAGLPARPGAPPGEHRHRALEDLTLQPGEASTITAEGEGAIGTIRVKLARPTGRVLRGVVLEVAFEEEGAACVRVPVGDFFGSGCGDRRFKSLPAGMTDEGYYAYWPMPFRELAAVTLRNETREPVEVERWRVEWSLGPQPANAGYFHARYVEDPDIPVRQDYSILDVTGRGKLVGANVTMQNTRGARGIFFLEGDEKIYVDGETYPSRWLGTGAEDYFNGAYFWNAPDKAAMARPHGGLTFLDWGIGRVCAYRWHILDFVSFRESIRLDLEHGGESDWPSHYQSVAYYYLEEPAPQPPLPSLAERLPKTPLPPAPRSLCCELARAPELAGRPLEKRRYPELDPGYDSGDSVFHGRGQRGDEVRVPLRVPGEDEFTVVLFVTGGPDHGRLSVALDGERLGAVDARRPAFTPWLAAELGRLRVSGGEHRLALELEGGEGTGSGPAELAVGLVAVQLKPHSRFIDQWSIAGNWPCPQEGGWEVAYGPEKSADLKAAYALPGGGEVRWREYRGERVGLAGGNWLVAYGLTYIRSPDERTVACFIGKDDGLKIWLNGEVAFDRYTWSHAWPDQFFCTFELKKGWNRVLVKCANWGGAWGFSLRPGDPDRRLEFARSPP
jgi:hypothetical protein